MAQDKMPELLDALTDCDVSIDRLTFSDYESQPRETEHDPLLKPRIEEDSVEGDEVYDEDEDGEHGAA